MFDFPQKLILKLGTNK